MKTVNIKGKEYVEVNERIKYFRNHPEEYPNGRINTSIESMVDGVCVVRAEIYVNDQLVATGHAYEKEGSTFINKTSYLENCETSAIGRALGILGIGIDTSVASKEEVENAINNQTPKKQYQSKPSEDYTSKDNLQGANSNQVQQDKIIGLINTGKVDGIKLLAYYKVKTVKELSYAQAEEILSKKG